MSVPPDPDWRGAGRHWPDLPTPTHCVRMMAVMATWEDGPEYAPIERPENFTAPNAGPLQPRPIEQSPGSPGVPQADQVPHGQPNYRPASAERPLPELGAQPPPARDPHRAFASASSTLTAFGTDADPNNPRRALPAETDPVRPDHQTSDHQKPGTQEFDPYRPMGRQPSSASPGHPDRPRHMPSPASPTAGQDYPAPDYPAPGTPAWFGPGAAPPQRPPAPSVGSVVAAITPAVVILLVLAGLVPPLSLPLYIVAMFASTRIRYRKSRVRNVFLTGLGTTLVVSLVALMLSMDTFGQWWDAMSRLSMVVSWAVLIILGFIMARALQNDEQPDQPETRA